MLLIFINEKKNINLIVPLIKFSLERYSLNSYTTSIHPIIVGVWKRLALPDYDYNLIMNQNSVFGKDY